MIKYYCDRCGNDASKEHASVIIGQYDRTEHRGMWLLCPPCVTIVHKAVTNV